MLTNLNITKVYLMLGEACNWKCRHCIQKPFHNSLSKTVSQKTIKYLQHLCDIKPRFESRVPNRVNVIFFGGEPLLYINQIKEVINKVCCDNVDYTIISNGELLTKEFVDYCNNNKIEFVLSNDGRQSAKVRDKNMLDNVSFVDMFKKIQKKHICTTLHAYNQDIYDLWEYVESKVPGVSISYQMLEHTYAMPDDIYNYDFNLWKQTVVKICQTIYDKMTQEINGEIDCRESEFLSPFILSKLAFDKNNIKYPGCGSWKNIANVDLDGNLFMCHNGMDKFSTADNLGAINEAQIRFNLLKYKAPTYLCDVCSAKCICHQCPYAQQNKGHAKQCKFIQILAEEIINTMKKVDEFYSTDIEL